MDREKIVVGALGVLLYGHFLVSEGSQLPGRLRTMDTSFVRQQSRWGALASRAYPAESCAYRMEAPLRKLEGQRFFRLQYAFTPTVLVLSRPNHVGLVLVDDGKRLRLEQEP